SSSSTSDGIIKVFQKAENYQKTSSKEFPLNTVVLLDQVGLAETSPYNPLNVLHSLLERSYPNELPNESVIGISNWRVDNSKSSRALLVQRPKFEKNDLIDTAERLFEKKNWVVWTNITAKLKSLASSYLRYEKIQPIENFHGLRDYYSLIKSLSDNELTIESTQMALARNFGGIKQMNNQYLTHFKDVIDTFHGGFNDGFFFNKTNNLKQISVEELIELIKANLKDKDARHLMIIGK
ncbi:44080_t:CDS:2, partial [Gigaspora margarita]